MSDENNIINNLNQIKPQKNVFICGSARNCGKYINAIFSNIKKISNNFDNFHIIVSFDLSTDNTLDQLNQYKKIYLEKMDIIINEEPLSPIRVERISNSRNRIMEKMREMINKTQHWNYFIMMDFDDVCSYKINRTLIPYYLNRTDWDCLTFNRKNYYDIWALSFENYIYSCWNFPNSKKVVKDMKKLITQKLTKLPQDQLYRCYSAFNGFGIYRIEKFIDCEYRWIIDYKQFPRSILERNFALTGTTPIVRNINQDCEHRSFHFQAIKNHNAQIMISPHNLFLNFK